MRLSRDPYRRMTSSRLGRLCRKRAKGDTRDQDTCCRAVRSCSGSCRKAVTAMTFLVISHDYSVDLKTFDVPTYCVCN
ncbi:hypothetical protein LSH36_302g04047 [Paralvinella palmiformis]|uniref:Uncharacterized protein n=1 Tax=Paralvinella palmiformis TaxID=53620 RepID=A0AAD9JHI9_9ANNE|nr:hypothetical protein LSH36_302g04047 [Paralvinella palmiformis]